VRTQVAVSLCVYLMMGFLEGCGANLGLHNGGLNRNTGHIRLLIVIINHERLFWSKVAKRMHSGGVYSGCC